MESCFLKEVQDTAEKVNKLREEGCFCFQVIADSHVSPLNDKNLSRQYRSYETIKAVSDAADFHAIFHLGDLLGINATQESRDYWSEENVEKWFEITRENLCAANPNTYFIAGNHDSVQGYPPERPWWYGQMVEFQKDRITGCVKNEPYYYVDFADVKVRAICLMSNYREDGKDYYGVYKEQVDWLAQDALLAPDGWHILLFTHIGPVEGLGYVSHSNDNITEFAAFLTAFQNKEKFASSVFSVDFRNAGTAKIVAMFVGHGHTDWILKPGILPCYLVETGSSLSHMPKRETWTMPADAVVPKREYNTVTEDIWDAVVFNPQKGTLDMIRFGAGDDRHIDL